MLIKRVPNIAALVALMIASPILSGNVSAQPSSAVSTNITKTGQRPRNLPMSKRVLARAFFDANGDDGWTTLPLSKNTTLVKLLALRARATSCCSWVLVAAATKGPRSC